MITVLDNFIASSYLHLQLPNFSMQPNIYLQLDLTTIYFIRKIHLILPLELFGFSDDRNFYERLLEC